LAAEWPPESGHRSGPGASVGGGLLDGSLEFSRGILPRLLGAGGAVCGGVGVRRLRVERSCLHHLCFVHPYGGGRARGMYLHNGLLIFSPAFLQFFCIVD